MTKSALARSSRLRRQRRERTRFVLVVASAGASGRIGPVRRVMTIASGSAESTRFSCACSKSSRPQTTSVCCSYGDVCPRKTWRSPVGSTLTSPQRPVERRVERARSARAARDDVKERRIAAFGLVVTFPLRANAGEMNFELGPHPQQRRKAVRVSERQPESCASPESIGKGPGHRPHDVRPGQRSRDGRRRAEGLTVPFTSRIRVPPGAASRESVFQSVSGFAENTASASAGLTSHAPARTSRPARPAPTRSIP